MNGEPSKHLNPLPAPAKTSAGALSAENLLKLWEQNTGHQPPDLKMEVLRELAETLWAPSNARSDDIDNKIAFALLRLAEIQPQDPMEWTLGEQMVATHTAAMDCYRRAALPNTAMEERQAELRQAQKLCQLHAHQIEVLDKHRGRGDRTVTVKHEVSHSHADWGATEMPNSTADGGVEQVPRLTKTETVQIGPSALQSRAGEPVRTGGQM